MVLKALKKVLWSLTRIVPDKLYLQIIFRKHLRKKLDLENPQTFNEKMQWLKLFNRKEIYSTMVDKYAVKDYVAKIIGEQYVIKTLGVWDSFNDIDFSTLPNQFVLKCTHDSGGIVICKNKNTFDIKKAKRIINSCIKNNYFYNYREWPYKNVKPRIIAEEYIEDSVYKELRDYKFFTFKGITRMMFVASDRQNKQTKFDFFDEKGTYLQIINGHPNSQIVPALPKNFELMKKLAFLIGKDAPFLRVDFYEANGRVYFGEITFFHFSGLVPFEPEKWDYVLGDMIELPKKEEL